MFSAFDVLTLADQVIAQSVTGLYYRDDPRETDRYTRLRSLACELLARLDGRTAAAVAAMLPEPLRPQTPLAGVALEVPGWPTVPCRMVRPAESPTVAVTALATAVIGTGVRPRLTGIIDSVETQMWCRHTYFYRYTVDTDAPPHDHVSLPSARPGIARDTEEVRAIRTRVRELAAAGAQHASSHYDRDRYRLLAAAERALLEHDCEAAPVAAPVGLLDVVTPTTGAEVAVTDTQGRVLLMRRADTGQWAMPGGACEAGETAEAAVRRELREETGLDAEPVLVDVVDNRDAGAASAPIQLIALFRADFDPAGGVPVTTAEATALGWYQLDEIADLDMFDGHATKLRRVLSR